MSARPTPPVLWEPSDEAARQTTMWRFLEAQGLDPADYAAAWEWSVEDLDRFWRAVSEFFGVRWASAPSVFLADARMPGATWCPGGKLSYAEHVLTGPGKDDDALAIQHRSESRAPGSWTWGELRAQVARIRAGLVGLGVGEGDRVCAYLPNLPETVAAFLATASLGAVWSSAAPEFGARSVIDRFAQIEPKVLLAVDGYRYGGRDFDRAAMVSEIHAGVGGRLVRLGYLDGTGWEDGFLADGPLEFVPLAFDHPLWVLYSSGTTGLPKAIVQGQGGILLEHLKQLALHADARPGDRLFWFTTTGWMMWNFLVGALLPGASIVLFDGNPGHPDLTTLWDLAEDARVTTFGTSAAFLASCQKAGVRPAASRDLSALRGVGSTGSPLSPEGFQWVYDEVGDVWLFSTSGGTDVCTAFVGGVPTLPVHRGELQARALGCAVESWDEEGRPVVGEVGELVVTKPMPSMPVGFWGDDDGSRYRAAYFEHFPGVWRHGDWIELTERGTAIISGRSDSTINRGGVRMGTAEIYRAVLAEDAVVDALVVDVPREGAEAWMPLFVVLRPGLELTDELVAAIRRRVRSDCSPRHVPDEVLQVAQVPRTLSGKVLEVPVKRILMGVDPARAASRESLADPAALEPFVALAASRAGSGAAAASSGAAAAFSGAAAGAAGPGAAR
jgi:acetoacetyl-CoA synthetase